MARPAVIAPSAPSRLSVTESDLLDALQTARHASDEGPTDAHTTEELAMALDVDARLARRQLRALWQQGRIETVRVRRPAMDGRRCVVVAYRLIAPPAPVPRAAPRRRR